MSTSNLTVRTINSVAELRAQAVQWDDLWQRSSIAWPTAQAELLAQWLEQFAAGAVFEAVTVWQGEKLVAALPLSGRRLAKLFVVGRLTGNEWCPAGDLILDNDATDDVLDTLAAGLDASRWPLIWCEAAPLESARWQRLLAALERRKLRFSISPRGRIVQCAMEGTWDAYLAGRSKNMRRQMRTVDKKAAEAGNVQLVQIDNPPLAELPALIERAFRVEDNSWKGRDGSSVLRTPGMLDYFIRQASELSRRGQLKLVFLELDGESVAFEYAWLGKQTFFPVKIGFDERFGQFSPGQLIRWRMFEQMFGGNQVRLVDFAGPLVEATERWSTNIYTMSRLAIAPRRLSSELLLSAVCDVRPAIKRCLQREPAVSAS